MKKSNAEAARKSRERAKIRDQQQKEKLERLIEENSRMKKQIAEKQIARNIMANILEKNSLSKVCLLNEEKEILSQAFQPSDCLIFPENKSDLTDEISQNNKFISDGVSLANIESETKITEVCHPCQDDYSNIKNVLEDNCQETFIENLNLIPNERAPLTNDDYSDDLYSRKLISQMEQKSNKSQKMNSSLSESDYKLLSQNIEYSESFINTVKQNETDSVDQDGQDQKINLSLSENGLKLLSQNIELTESFKNTMKHNEPGSSSLKLKLINQEGQDQKMNLSLSKNGLKFFYQNIESQGSLLNTVKQNKMDSTEFEQKDDVKTSIKSLSLLSLSNMSIDISFSSLVP
ncbi:unnamed protein product [Brachionus calyciflorus]|uniref:BZIP domain-containing protein n=1 Tax=Brachionus calyciflorus TaxID=104777 RepID=A0A814KS50_9BILA|nr:unnamed protein product [Brachionus calyciflorus]